MTRPIILHTILNAALFFFFLKLFSRSIGITNHIHNPIITDIIIFQCLRNKETNEKYRFLYFSIYSFNQLNHHDTFR